MLNRKSHVALAVALAALSAVGLAACGGNALSTTGPSAYAADVESTVIVSAAFDDVEVGGQRVVDFTLPRAGNLALRVNWNDQNNSVIAVLTGADCIYSHAAAAGCQERRAVERQGKEGREGVIDYSGRGGAYRLTVENEGPGAESIRVTAVLVSSPVAPDLPTPYPTSHPSGLPR